MNRRVAGCVLGTVFVTIAMVAPGFAQFQNGTLRGVVLDPQGGAVAGAKVQVTNENTNVSLSTDTSSAGVYTLPGLLIGSYTLKADAEGFAGYTRTGIQVSAAQVTDVTVSLQVAGTTTSITVQSGKDVVQTESSQVNGTFESQALANIPIATGSNLSVFNLAIYLPNTTAPAGGTSGNGGSVGGLRGRSNSFSIDGVDDLDPSTTVASQQVIPDAVQEFTINQNVFSAEYGRGAGGQFNVVTKTGTNQLHFDSWIYNNNRAYNAKDNLEVLAISQGGTGKRRYDFNRVGGDVGGALIKDKLFLYGAYEFNNLGQQATASALAPTSVGLAMLKNLAVDSQVRDLLAQFPVSPVQTSSILIKTPAVATGAAVPIGTVISATPTYTNQMDYNVNADWTVSDNQSLHVRYLKERIRQPNFGSSFPQAQFSSLAAIDDRRLIVNHITILNPRLVNDFRSSFARHTQFYSLTDVGRTFPTLIIDDLQGVVIGPRDSLPQHRVFNEYLLGDSMTWTTGNHTFKWGGQFFWFTSPSEFLQNQRGQYAYTSDSNGGGGLQQLINDQFPSKAGFTLQGLGSGFFSGNSINFNLFVQDDIKVNPHLILNVGIRYDYFGNPAGVKSNALNSVASLPGTPLVFDVPKTDRNNWGPRVGFAWDPTGSGKWAIRGGAGVTYDVIPSNLYANSTPVQQQVLLTSRTAACAGTFGPPPAWCLPSTGPGSGFLANGAMKLNFTPPTTQAAARAQTSVIMADARAPKIFSWSLSVERQVLKNSSVELRYVGTRGLGLPVQLQLNSITAFEQGAQALPTYIRAADVPASASVAAPTLAAFSLLSGKRRYAAQGFTGGVITDEAFAGASAYHGGSVDFKHRFNRGLFLDANYTFAKAMDDSTNDLNTSAVNPRRPENSYNLANEWARSAVDVRHKVALTFVYDTPEIRSGSRFLKGAFNGWEWSGSYIFQTGQPVTIQSGVDANGNGDSAGDRAILNPDGTEGVGSLVNRVCRDPVTSSTSIKANSTAGCASANTVGYVAVNPNARYVQAASGTVSNLGRNTFTSPHTNIWNMSIMRKVNITERASMEFRVDAYDVFNHPNYTLNNPGGPGGSVNIFSFTTNALNSSYANLNSGVTSGSFLNAPALFNGGAREIVLGARIRY